MCGIVGYVGQRPAQELLLAGLEKLEYRGYDSAGISLLADGELESVRAVGNLARAARRRSTRARPTAAASPSLAPPATTGIGHTRWATHGRVTEENAHPHYDTGQPRPRRRQRHRRELHGAQAASSWPRGAVLHLRDRRRGHRPPDRRAPRRHGLVEAVRRAYNRLRGHYAFVAVAADEPDVLVGARKECPLIVGRGDGEQFLASAIPAFLAHTRRVQSIENDEIVVLAPRRASSS